MGDLKMRVPDSRAYNAMMQATGAAVVAVDLSELYLALSQGVADGQDTPPSVVKSNKFYEVQKYISKTDHVLTNAYSIINAATFDGYSNAGREGRVPAAACTDADRVACASTRPRRTEGGALYDFLKEKGMQVTLDIDIDSFQQACSGVITKFPDLFPPELVRIARSTPA